MQEGEAADMIKKIVDQERLESKSWVGEYHKWECGCSEIVFWDRGPSINRKMCGNDHEKPHMLEKRIQTNLALSY